MQHSTIRLISESDAALYLGCSRSFLRQSRMNGNLPGRSAGPPWVRLGRRGIRYDRRDLDDWLEARKEQPKQWADGPTCATVCEAKVTGCSCQTAGGRSS